MLGHTGAAVMALVAQGAPDGIDPLSLLEWRAACQLVKEHEAAIWPGYRLEEIPALISHPKVAELLMRHPQPPADYVRWPDASVLGEEPLFVRRGTTIFDGVTDTSHTVGGLTTLVVTDRGARDTINNPGDDAWNLAVAVHEGFHAWAASRFKQVGGDELDLVEWPDLDAGVAAHLHLEGSALVAAVRALASGASDEVEEQSLLFLAERQRRRAAMPAAATRYEDGNELNEGLASYVELRAYELWAEHGLGDELKAALPALKVPAAFRERADGMVNMLLHSSRGSFTINGTTSGPAVIRRRGYFSGAAIGKLLDHFSPDAAYWKREVAHGRPLTELLAEALGSPAAEELAERADALEADSDFAQLVPAKEKLAADARREHDQRIAAVLGAGAGTLLVIDVAALAPKERLVPAAWNPFGILKIDESRRLFSQSTTTFVVAGVRIDALDRAGVVVDAARHELLLRSPLTADALKQALVPWPGRYTDAAVTIEPPKDPAGVAMPLLSEVAPEPGDDGAARVRLRLRRAP